MMDDKSVAICISGCVRSFPRESVRDGLKVLLNDFPNADFFLCLKTRDKEKKGSLMNTNAGFEGFMKTIETINRNRIVKLVLFDRCEDPKVDRSNFGSQIRTIDYCFQMASQHKEYDYYLRYRPDFVLLRTRLPSEINDNAIYTTRKKDATGSDQVFLISKKMKEEWWDKKIKNHSMSRFTPEYVIFKCVDNVKNGPQFYGGLLRNDKNNLLFWDNETRLHIKDDWIAMFSNKTSGIEKSFIDKIVERLNCEHLDTI